MTEQSSASSSVRPHLAGFVNEVFNLVESVIPPENVRQHFRNSRIEFWKGMRALIDVRIDQISRKGEQQRGAAVPVE